MPRSHGSPGPPGGQAGRVGQTNLTSRAWPAGQLCLAEGPCGNTALARAWRGRGAGCRRSTIWKCGARGSRASGARGAPGVRPGNPLGNTPGRGGLLDRGPNPYTTSCLANPPPL
eukprot:gene15176-biopygen5175